MAVLSIKLHHRETPARIIRSRTAIEAQPLRSEGVPFRIANGKSQIPNMKSAI
jgi:hypothetical protein